MGGGLSGTGVTKGLDLQNAISSRLLNQFLKMKVFWNQEEKGYHLVHIYIYIFGKSVKMQEDELRYVSQFVRTKKLLNKETLKMNKIS